MPYLIEKSCGTRTSVDMTAEEARFKAQSARVIETAADGSEIGDVLPDGFMSADAVEQALEADHGAAAAPGATGEAEAAPTAKPAAKKAAKAKK